MELYVDSDLDRQKEYSAAIIPPFSPTNIFPCIISARYLIFAVAFYQPIWMFGLFVVGLGWGIYFRCHDNAHGAERGKKKSRNKSSRGWIYAFRRNRKKLIVWGEFVDATRGLSAHLPDDNFQLSSQPTGGPFLHPPRRLEKSRSVESAR